MQQKDIQSPVKADTKALLACKDSRHKEKCLTLDGPIQAHHGPQGIIQKEFNISWIVLTISVKDDQI
jgi:hypothetical protein